MTPRRTICSLKDSGAVITDMVIIWPERKGHDIESVDANVREISRAVYQRHGG